MDNVDIEEVLLCAKRDKKENIYLYKASRPWFGIGVF